MLKAHYNHAWKCISEAHYLVQWIYANKKNKREREERRGKNEKSWELKLKEKSRLSCLHPHEAEIIQWLHKLQVPQKNSKTLWKCLGNISSLSILLKCCLWSQGGSTLGNHGSLAIYRLCDKQFGFWLAWLTLFK